MHSAGQTPKNEVFKSFSGLLNVLARMVQAVLKIEKCKYGQNEKTTITLCSIVTLKKQL